MTDEPQTYDEAVERVHRAFCDPQHELVGPWDQEMAAALKRNGYAIAQEAPAPEGLRAALDAVLAYHHPNGGGERCFALAATPSTPAEPPPCNCYNLALPAGIGHAAECPVFLAAVRAEARPPEGLDGQAAAFRGALASGAWPDAAGTGRKVVYLEAAQSAVSGLAEWIAARLSAGGATKPQPTVGNRPDVATPRVAKATRGAKGAR